MRKTTPKANPLVLATALLEHDLYGVWESQYQPKNKPNGLTLAEFFSLTPAQMMRMFFRDRNPNRKLPDNDAVALLRRVNQHLGEQGRRPVTPEWFVKKVRDGK
ncbi:MAG TPA: hypothetical protein VN641_18675 [Urbifossiella sp.]|nr:hypothetical protein [Urbifossiella sp.]